MPNRILHQWKPLAMNIRKEESLLYEEKEASDIFRKICSFHSPPCRVVTQLDILNRLVNLHESSFRDRATGDEADKILGYLRSAMFSVVTCNRDPAEQVDLLLKSHQYYIWQLETTDRLMLFTGEAIKYFFSLLPLVTSFLREEYYSNAIANAILRGHQSCGFRALHRFDFGASLAHMELAFILRRPCRRVSEVSEVMLVCKAMLECFHKLNNVSGSIDTASAFLDLCGQYKTREWSEIVAYKLCMQVLTQEAETINAEELSNEIESARLYLLANDFQETPAYVAVLLVKSLIAAHVGDPLGALHLGLEADIVQTTMIADKTSYRFLWASHIILCDHYRSIDAPVAFLESMYGACFGIITNRMNDASTMIAFTKQRLARLERREVGETTNQTVPVPESFLCECFLFI